MDVKLTGSSVYFELMRHLLDVGWIVFAKSRREATFLFRNLLSKRLCRALSDVYTSGDDIIQVEAVCITPDVKLRAFE